MRLTIGSRLLQRARSFVHHARNHGFFDALLRTLRFVQRQSAAAGPSHQYAYREDFDADDLRRKVALLPWQPLISIILPVHDTPLGFLRLAVASVCDQIYENWELCIVDDCSTDPALRAYLEALEDRRIRFRRLDTNGGISVA